MYQWRWTYQIPSLAVWAVVLLLLVLPKENRGWQAWLILVPLAVDLVLWKMILRLLSMPSSENYGVVYFALAIGWVAVWLVGQRFPRRYPLFAMLLAITVILGAAATYHLGTCGLDSGDELPSVLVFCGICAVVLVLPMGLSRLFCRKRYGFRRFMLWLLAWSLIVPVAAMLTLCAVLAILGAGSREVFASMLTMGVIVAGVLGGIVYLMNLPFMVLARHWQFYRERFESALRLVHERKHTDDEAGQGLDETSELAASLGP